MEKAEFEEEHSKKAHIVLAHPEPKSLNGHLAATSQSALRAAGWQTSLSDLYAMDFDPREGAFHYKSRKDKEVFHTQTEQRFNAENETTPSDVNAEAQRLLDSDLLVAHFPFWWYGMPAILKGWMDRVFVYGPMYRSTMRFDAGVCAGKKMIVCVTAAISEDSLGHNGWRGSTIFPLEPLLSPYRYLGYEVYEPEIFFGITFVERHDRDPRILDTYSNQWAATLERLSSRPLVQFNRDVGSG